MSQHITIVFADDMEQYRGMVLEQLRDHNVECIGQAANGKELLALSRLWDADIIVLDLEMPLMDGNEAMDRIMSLYPEAKVLVMSFHYESELVDDYMCRGAMGYISKDVACGNIEILVEALQTIKSGEVFVYQQPPAAIKTFTRRQVQMIPLICNDRTNRQIAGELGISERSVEKQRQKIYQKADVKGSTSFLKYAFRKGLDFLRKNA